MFLVVVATALPIWTYEGFVFAEVCLVAVGTIGFLQGLPPRAAEALYGNILQAGVERQQPWHLPGGVDQSVTCLATDASLTADPGVASSIPARSHTFVEIDHEIISTVILLPSAESFKKGCCQLQAKVCAQSTG